MLPNKIKIGGLDYEVINTDKFDEYIYGSICYDTLKIKIDNRLCAERQMSTLIHEIVHGIFAEIGERKMYCYERLVDSFGNILYQVLKDNKELIQNI
jgi:hypothetical protein